MNFQTSVLTDVGIRIVNFFELGFVFDHFVFKTRRPGLTHKFPRRLAQDNLDFESLTKVFDIIVSMIRHAKSVVLLAIDPF
jgi:hypothetical protein